MHASGRVLGLLAVGGVLADRAVRVREKAMRAEVRPRRGCGLVLQRNTQPEMPANCHSIGNR